MNLSNDAYLTKYIGLFHCLAAKETESAKRLWKELQEAETEDIADELGAIQVKKCLKLSDREFLLMMAAMALEIDAILRHKVQTNNGLLYPTLECGLVLTAPLIPFTTAVLGELTSENQFCELCLIADEQNRYTLSRSLILSRALFIFLTSPQTPLRLTGLTKHVCDETQTKWLPLHEDALVLVQRWWEGYKTSSETLCLYGPLGCGRRTLLLRACGGYLWAEGFVEASRLERKQLIREAAALSLLTKLPVAMPGTDDDAALRLIENYFHERKIPLVVIAHEESQMSQMRHMIRLKPVLTPLERDSAVAEYLKEDAQNLVLSGDMSIGAVVQIAKSVKQMAKGRAAVQADVQRAMMLRASRTPYGIEYRPDINLSDLVVPQEVTNQLRLICAAGRNSARLREWGIPRVREGVTAVFHGPPGTGKTMAACAIAKELNMPLLRVDLSQIMDKYVGETEKHLADLLTNAKENQCVLLFDEADSLFGKRTAMDTGHDKYANLTVSFLLQEMDHYHGVALLSTNLLQNFDAAFFRRLNYIVHFPLPDFPLRLALWDAAFPKNKREEGLPLELFAQVELSPACIFAIARGAAVCAMAHGRSLFTLFDVQQATRLELEKQGKMIPGFLEQAAPV